jgi:trans-aconitate methyltransferase
MNKWRDIWNKRKLPDKSSLLQSLIAADGFDSGAGEVLQENWLHYVDWVIKVLEITKTDSIFELGCGSGAFLYPFWERGYKINGADRSKALIDIAKNVMSDVPFSVCDANEITSDEKYDFTISNGVFHYFPDLQYAEQVLFKMLEKAIKKVMICDIPNLATKEQAEEYRRNELSEGEYEAKYKGLEHLYYSKGWFQEKLSKHKCHFEIFDQNINDYGNNDFRFNVVISKL